jgi:hypothetical protein
VLRQARRDGINASSRAADPQSADLANGNFRLKPSSPALKLGFVFINQSKIGLQEAPSAPSR